MTTLQAPTSWLARAACTGEPTDHWFGRDYQTGKTICGRCPVRAECLLEAVKTESDHRYGVWGGLTGRERAQLPPLPERDADAITALREHLAALDSNDQPPPERTDPPMTADTTTTPPADTELTTVSKLLRWAEEHPDGEIRDQGARAEAAITSLRQRYVADQELAAITTERERLEQRLAALQAREAELAPPKRKAKKVERDYEPAAVRAWAAENGVDCPALGRVPKAVVDLWRAAQNGAQ
ncbi:WhiB family transcriptional regulator [Streptomyces longwoodensis]|uniref:WhiB family transcriptional regulator n=1 Tax=Streptomyces longwoodensis TaxID=68231 RepID=UPI002DDA8BB9|nr:histone-like nucleoid-structuring protein Lsr2 [Streptomyces longwoodensis]WRY88786.1 WhiB family transcriptional regulator [Streptomyces longwoodensis]